MAFENAFLTEEEKAEFNAKGIRNPAMKASTMSYYTWTIDREKGVFLIRGGQDREEPNIYYFLLYWKGAPLNVKLKQRWEQGAPRIWKLCRLYLEPEMEVHRQEILDDLKEALTVWAFNGNPSEDSKAHNQYTKVEFTF